MAIRNAPTLRLLAMLERERDRRSPSICARRLAALQALARRRLTTAAQVRRLHEILCFLRAYPDTPTTLGIVRLLLAGFAQRMDLQTQREALRSSGIAGTAIDYPFFHPTAHWLAACWPHALTFDRSDTLAGETLAKVLPVLVSPVEAHALRESHLTGYDALDRLRGGLGDAAWLLARIDALPGDGFTREAFYDLINPSCTLAPARGAPVRTTAHWNTGPTVYRRTDLHRGRPDLRAAMSQPPRRIVRVPDARANALLDLARAAMVTRGRDLDAIAYGNARDLWWIDDDDGLAFALIGVAPARRVTIPAIYGGLMLANGVPIGYLQADVIGRSIALSFNTFETFRGGESAWVFGRLLAALHATFHATSFSIEPYQLGHGNDEGLASGAWWFYRKLGFQPRAPRAVALAAAEQRCMQRDPTHRSSATTLALLARDHLHFDLDPARPATLVLPAAIGLRLGAWLGQQSGDAVEVERRALATCGLSRRPRFNTEQRNAWQALSPLYAMLSGLRWIAAERAALVELVRAKAAPSERRYAELLARQTSLLAALARLSASG